jgi:hypothetical protein
MATEYNSNFRRLESLLCIFFILVLSRIYCCETLAIARYESTGYPETIYLYSLENPSIQSTNSTELKTAAFAAA